MLKRMETKDWTMAKWAGVFACGMLVGVVVTLLLKPGGGSERTETDGLDTMAIDTSFVDVVAEDDAQEGRCPAEVYGIDVSVYQDTIDWDNLSDFDNDVYGLRQVPLKFVFVRATKGTAFIGKGRKRKTLERYVDSMYAYNYAEAKRHGFHRGVYHYLTMDEPGAEQARFFLKNVQLEKGDLPPVLDYEIRSPRMVPIVKDWLAVVERELGVKAIIYTTRKIYNEYVKDDPVLSDHDFWMAKPDQNLGPDIPNTVFWQFSHHGEVREIPRNYVDLDKFNGTYQDFLKYIDEKGIK